MKIPPKIIRTVSNKNINSYITMFTVYDTLRLVDKHKKSEKFNPNVDWPIYHKLRIVTLCICKRFFLNFAYSSLLTFSNSNLRMSIFVSQILDYSRKSIRDVYGTGRLLTGAYFLVCCINWRNYEIGKWDSQNLPQTRTLVRVCDATKNKFANMQTVLQNSFITP